MLTFILASSSLYCLHGQAYDTALGMRLGTDWGVTVQQRVAKRTTIEAIVQSSLQREEAIVSLLGEQHFPLVFRNFNIYAGGGFHKGWINTPADSDVVYENPFGVSFIAGIEFSLGRLNVSYDFKPTINFVGGENKVYTQTGISLRYIIIRRELHLFNNNKKKKKNQGNWKFWENW